VIAGVVLAAGASTRAGYAKALATIDGEPLVARIARNLGSWEWFGPVSLVPNWQDLKDAIAMFKWSAREPLPNK